MSTQVHKIIIAEPHRLIAECLCKTLEQDRRFKVLATITGPVELHALVPRLAPDLVLLSERMPQLNGMPTPIKLRNNDPRLRVAALITGRGVIDVPSLELQGYHGAISAHAGVSMMGHILAQVMDGHSFPVLQAQDTVDHTPCHGLLTIREMEVVRCIAKGMKSPQIASDLEITVNTVLTHRRNIARKLEAQTSAEMILKAQRIGLL